MSACSLFLCLTWLLPLHAAEPSNAKTALHTAALESQKLRVVIADNEAYAPTHQAGYNGVAASHRPAGSTWDPSFDEGFRITLASGFSDFEYLYPFYFGRSGENVLVLMFEKPRDGGEMRFAQSPSGGGTGNPAWDFVYFRRDYAVGRAFKFRVRAVYRKFTNVEDIVRLYERWSEEKVRRPSN